ncbi:uncharacterized protein RCO7_03012 [Rhynchosporium graminicola]|uniref:BTB domain-containing protein n=1 Tax=Rhynchosporium graminicola TaxID=2792576 RepID=A0A1E1KRD7_9HELO|nr:uncharacterized protein RCO7_03012 [Rhynchosporium commune]
MSSPDLPVSFAFLDRWTSDTSASSFTTPLASISTAAKSMPAGRTPDKIVAQNASFKEQFGSEIVKISVDRKSKKQEFHIHKNLLCQKAPVFDRMFSSNFAEGQKGEAELPEDDPQAFDAFAAWLYCDAVATLVNENEGVDRRYIQLFIFAEKYGIIRLADNTMDAFLKNQTIIKTRPGPESSAMAYEGTYVGSKLRLYVARCWAYAVLQQETEVWTSASLVPIGDKAQELLLHGLKLLRNLNKVKNSAGKKLIKNPKLAAPCDYHQHGKDEVCPYTKDKKRELDESN